MYERSELQEIINRSKEPRRFIQVLIGPRQVGKTTLILQLIKKITIPTLFEAADLVPVSGSVWLEQVWENARFQMDRQNTNEFILIIDEIQKIGNWSEIVKQLWDADTRAGRNMKVILLGSSRLLIQQGLTESLGGRFETTYLGHWNYTEMKDAFGWTAKQYAWFGGYPGSASLIEDEKRWKNYVSNALIETSVSKDILMLTRVDKPALMKRLFEIGCLYSGQIVAFIKLQGQLKDAGNTTTLSHYLTLLDTTGLLGGLEKYAGDTIRKRSSSPKFQVHNTALISAQRNETFDEITQRLSDWGRIVESAVGAHLMNFSLIEGYGLHYWRNGDKEVDFVLEKGGKLIGLEVKSGSGNNTAGMEAFKKDFNPDKVLLIGSNGLPWEEFLEINPVQLF